MQDVDNFGSLLQAYGLKKILCGNSVEFIPIKKNDEDNSLLDNKILDFSNEQNKSNKIINKLSRLDFYLINRIILKKKDNMQNNIFSKFRQEYLNIDYDSNKDKYDLCIIGSDEVFNCLVKSPWGFTSQLFGNIENAKSIISYAASCGATSVDKIPSQVKEKISMSLSKLNGISVRDKNTMKFVEQLSDKECCTSLDPVLISDFEEEILNNKFELDYDYCIVYSYYNRIKDKKEISMIKKFCRQNKLKIISVGAPQFWIKNHIVCNPFEMLYIFKNAKFVITDTFHGTIFATKYSNNFATIVRDSNKNKIIDLLNRVDLSSHLIKSIEDINDIYIQKKDDNKILEYLNCERKNTINYLKKFANINAEESAVLCKRGDKYE